ncbi:hypothetical protein JOQ06_018164 [Pogonophryne albipinna]|uniref:Lipocalin/cytosolic fatty-acid binding domain-containing protein n=1 Tax=Pogonophryne albipinna TaxID=1090488 RepID=A0AAD6AIJ6_9TELE|nr:hypothetical protein JOQ06_018164 [Pogonophryne albipinna]
MSAVYLLLLLLPLVSAQTYHWGPCPDPKVQPNFNLQQYLGKWYEIEKLPASFERGKCIEANYAVRKDTDSIKTREPAKLGVGFSYFAPYGSYWVVTTDYTSMTVVYSCTDILRLFHFDYAWILGRSRFLPAQTVRNAKDLLIQEGIDLSKMKATDQTGCKDN